MRARLQRGSRVNGFSQSTCLPASSDADRPRRRGERPGARCRPPRRRGRRSAPHRCRTHAGSPTPRRTSSARACSRLATATTSLSGDACSGGMTRGVDRRGREDSPADRLHSARSYVGVRRVIGAMRRLLVANRGEIALRIFRACRSLGIETVAVVAPDDRGSLHARSADAIVEIASYLDAAEHVRAARESGADAVHPGYGFLAESAELAEAVLDARARRGSARRPPRCARAATSSRRRRRRAPPASRCCRAGRRRSSASRCS